MEQDPLLVPLVEHIGYLPEQHRAQILKAYKFARTAHEGQYRRSGEPYITHPVAVASILARIRMDAVTLTAALLHDVIEDCNVTKDSIADQFGSIVSEIVDGVSKITAIEFASQAIAQAENFRKMMLAMTRDIRVIIVKLADRLHNMRTLSVLNAAKRRRIATETLEIYAPIANRLGMNDIRMEFEDLGFRALYPMRSQRIAQAVRTARGNRTEIMSTLQSSIATALSKEHIQAKVQGREKHLYSIYQKMKQQRKSFSQIMDVYGIRIITDNLQDCYRCLGVVHNLYKPIPGRFKDYIAIPKTNDYQSIHTTLVGLAGVPIEIQIRTQDMETMANNGIASHWRYKFAQNHWHDQQEAPISARPWLNALLDLQENTGNSLEFIENVKIDLFPDVVYLFSPQGDILELPKGATSVDFAYAIHTDIGTHCLSSEIDGKVSALSTPLENGQSVKIITSSTSMPQASWLNFVVTGKARTQIKHFINNQKQTESINLGKRLLSKAFAAEGFDLDTEITGNQTDNASINTEAFAKRAGAQHLDQLFEEIGLGKRMAPVVAQKVILEQQPTQHPTSLPLTIEGSEGLIVQFAKCCHPIPGDSIMAYLSPGRGLIIHIDTCHNIARELEQSPEKCLTVNWGDDHTNFFSASLRIEALNQKGVLGSLANAIALCHANIDAINMAEKDAHMSVLHLILSVRDRIHLARIIRRLRINQSVTKITRMRGQ